MYHYMYPLSTLHHALRLIQVLAIGTVISSFVFSPIYVAFSLLPNTLKAAYDAH